MRVVFDTSVLVAATHSRSGASFALVSPIPSPHFEICLSIGLYMEWLDVLSRSEHLPPGRTADADAAPSVVGRWELNMGLGEAAFISMLALDPDGTFRMTTRKPNDPKPLLDHSGKYILKDDVIELHFAAEGGRERKPMTMKWKREPDTLWLSDMRGSEKMPYRLLKDTK